MWQVAWEQVTMVLAGAGLLELNLILMVKLLLARTLTLGHAVVSVYILVVQHTGSVSVSTLLAMCSWLNIRRGRRGASDEPV